MDNSAAAHAAEPVAILRWPMEAARRRALAAEGRPRILLVDDDVEPPRPLDDLEDWLRSPPEPIELETRISTITRRIREHPRPLLDADGLLRFGDRWVAVPDAQLPVVTLLLEEPGRLVTTAEIRDAYTRGGGSGHGGSIRTLVARLVARLDEVGLRLERVRTRGVVLVVPTTEPGTPW